MPGKREIMAIYERHAQTVYRVCYTYMKNVPEAEDMTQETFLRLMTWDKTFENERHEKAWLIVTASNLCKNALKKWRRYGGSIDTTVPAAQEETDLNHQVLEAILSLGREDKAVVYMYYYEGYTTAEIAEYMGCAIPTVRSRLSRARRKLKIILGGDEQ